VPASVSVRALPVAATRALCFRILRPWPVCYISICLLLAPNARYAELYHHHNFSSSRVGDLATGNGTVVGAELDACEVLNRTVAFQPPVSLVCGPLQVGNHCANSRTMK
jgi:hypothetical protein